jgi:anti-sigma B factor antagonist
MFDITRGEDGSIQLSGRLDAASAPVARDFLLNVESSSRLDFSDLVYIASAGLGILVAVQRRLMARGEGLSLSGLSPHLKEVLVLAGFEGIFKFE